MSRRRQYIETAYAADSEPAVHRVTPYYEFQEGEAPAAAFIGDSDVAEEDIDEADRRRLDVANLDGDGEIVVVSEAEQLNNDSYEAIPADYDKMTACEREEAIY